VTTNKSRKVVKAVRFRIDLASRSFMEAFWLDLCRSCLDWGGGRTPGPTSLRLKLISHLSGARAVNTGGVKRA